MININLLPDDLKKQRVILPKGIFIVLGIVLLSIFIIWSSLVSKGLAAVTLQSDELENKWQKILELKSEYGIYKKELKALEERAGVVNYLMADRIYYSQKLNELSDLLSDGIWLNALDLDGEMLTIEGKVYSKEGKEEAIVGNFMNSIKHHESFFKDFNDVELKIIKRKTQDIELISFVLFCHLKQPELPEQEDET
jgi:Tfp pilus assembly protein PilN